MAYTNFQNCTKQQYDNVIYGQNDVNRCKLYFNNVELEDADNYLEKITFTNRVLPENGKKVFSLDNFISQEVEIVIHDIEIPSLDDKVRIELGTIVGSNSLGDIYEDVPMGVYNIQDTPTRNDDKITIKLRDNAVLFDFNYDAKPLIDNQYRITTDVYYAQGKEYYVYVSSTDEYILLIEGTDYQDGDEITGIVYEKKGTASKMQILQDICNQANVVCNVNHFLGENEEVGTYDSTIKGRMYVAYLAEQAGCIAKIDRDGQLIFISLNSLSTQYIPLSIVSKYTIGTPYIIERVVYELGTIKFETSNDETLQTFYISSSNPFIEVQNQIDEIFEIIENFTVNSVEILSDIIGNPSIDGYDLIQVYDDESENDVVVFTTLANNTLIYNGKFKSKYKTEIGLEERKENTTNSGDIVFQKTIKSEIDRTNGRITTEITDAKDYTDGQIFNLGSSIEQKLDVTNTNLQDLTLLSSQRWEQTATQSQITAISSLIGTTEDGLQTQIDDVVSYVSFANESVTNPITGVAEVTGVVTIGKENNPLRLKLANGILYFEINGEKVAYLGTDNEGKSKLYIVNGKILTQLQIGNFAFIPRNNGSLSFRKIG